MGRRGSAERGGDANYLKVPTDVIDANDDAKTRSSDGASQSTPAQPVFHSSAKPALWSTTLEKKKRRRNERGQCSAQLVVVTEETTALSITSRHNRQPWQPPLQVLALTGPVDWNRTRTKSKETNKKVTSQRSCSR
jgi:hypothetical protein